jgi:YfiR/HmsC-like
MNIYRQIEKIWRRLLPLIALCCAGSRICAQTREQEADLKAVFIYNFTKYIDWDTAGSGNDFIIAIIGTSALTNPLQEIARTNTVKNKRIVIRIFSRPEEIGYCNILFIPQKLPFSLHAILDHVGRGVLTISEETGDASEGTAFNFVVINDKLKFESNLKALSSAGLRASSQLLKLAIIVD